MAKGRTGPFAFLGEVRQEARKVTWASRKETTAATITVFVMVALAAVFFLAVDQLLNLIVRFLLGLGG